MKKLFAPALVLLLLALSVQLAFAQNNCDITLYSSRLFGYSSGSGQVQGTFALKTTGPSDLNKVTFFIDGQVMGEVTQAPFEWRYNTDNYSLGVHTLSATGTCASGKGLPSNEIRLEFVSPEAGWQAALKIMVPILAVTFGAILLSVVFMFVTAPKLHQLLPGAPRSYGSAGGAICPRCKRPFSRRLLSPNMITGKLERCPYCGKWSIVSARPLDELRRAEAAELQDAHAAGLSPEAGIQDDLQRELDDSRFQDL